MNLRPLEVRFWERVDATKGVSECWPWTGEILNTGYGRFCRTAVGGKPKFAVAHRIAWELLRGPVPEGLQLDHLCRNRRCVNPAHLEPVTGRENLLRGESPAAKAARRTACIHGHSYTPENTHINRDGARACKACWRRNALASYYRNKQRHVAEEIV